MTTPLWCLFGYITWTVALLLSIAAVRGVQIATGAARASDFLAGVPHGSERYWRLNRAHLNCVENLPLFAAVVLTGAVIGADSPTLNQLSVVLLSARVCQSLTHIASGSERAIQLRFGFFATQVACLLWMLLHIAQTLPS